MNSLAEWLAAYLDHGRGQRYSSLTLRSRRYQVQAFLDWLRTTSGVRTVDRLQVGQLEAWQRRLTAVRAADGLPLKPRTINKYLASVRGFLKHLVHRGCLPQSVFAALAYVREPRVLPSSVLNHDDVQRLLAGIDLTTISGLRDSAMLELAYSSGLRAGEILGLNPGDIDWTNATATVTGKGSKQRVVPIGQTSLARLASYLKTARPFLLLTAGQPALFLDDQGGRMPYHTFRRLVHRHAACLGLNVSVTPTPSDAVAPPNSSAAAPIFTTSKISSVTSRSKPSNTTPGSPSRI